MTAFYLFWPSDLASLSLSDDGNSDNSISCDDHELILIIVEWGWSEPDRDVDCHSRCDISWGFLGILDIGYDKFFLFEGCDFDSLYEFGVVNEFDFCFIEMVVIIIWENELFWFYFEFVRSVFWGGEGLCIADGLIEMSGIFGEVYFSVHAFCDLLVVDLLLDVEFG